MKKLIAADQITYAAASAAVSQVDWPVNGGMLPSLTSSLTLTAEASPARQPVVGPCEAPRVSLRRSLFRQ
jgi:hypothetical protein